MKTIGKYLIGEEMGRTATGVTCRVRDPFRNRDYVLKILSPVAALSAPSKERLYRDLAATWELTHPYIAKIQDIGEVESVLYIATETLAGSTLIDFLSSELPSIPERLTLMAQVCEGLAYAYSQGIAHGNLKPSNILIGEKRNAVLLDYGTGSWQSILLASGVRLNGLSPNYLSPEQILGEEFDGRSDVFSAGIILYEILTGEYPFRAAPGVIPREIVHAEPQPLRQWNAEISEELEQIVFRALKKDRRERFQNAGELAANLYRVARHMRSGPSAQPAVFQPTPVSETAPDKEMVEGREAATIPEAPLAFEMPKPIAEPAVATEAIQAPLPQTPAPSVPVSPALMPIPPAQPAAPSVAFAPPLAVPPAARPSSPARPNTTKRQLVTFALGAVMALSIVGVIEVRQNIAAPGPSHPPAQPKPALKQIEAPAAPEAAKPTPFPTRVPAAQPAEEEARPRPAADQILRGQVRPLWEAGQYAEAMRLVDEVLVGDPANAEARVWKRRIRAAQDAEAGIK